MTHYDRCPVCGKKGWHRKQSSMFYRGYECRYCGSWVNTEKRHAREPVWEVIPGAKIRRGPKAPKQQGDGA